MSTFLRLYERQRFDLAYTVLQNWIEHDPTALDIGDTYVYWASLELDVNRDAQEALRLLECAKEVGCVVWDFYYAVLADALWYAGDREQALDLHEKNIEVEASVLNLVRFGIVLSCARDQRAGDVLHRVLEEDPRNCLAHVYLGYGEFRAGDHEKALAMACKAEDLVASPRDAYELGSLYGELKQFHAAIRQFFKAQKLGFWDKNVLNACLADCYLSLGEVGKANKHIRRALRCSPHDEHIQEIAYRCRETKS